LSFIIALVATLAIGYQGRAFWSGFLWATIHGVGPARFVAFAPVAIAFALIWIGYAVLRRRTLAFAVYALVLLGINEALVPGGPVKSALNEKALEGVELRNVRDEPLLTARGNPIGIRFHLEATVPSAGPWLISPSVLSPVSGEYPPYELQFGGYPPPLIEPSPSRDENSYYEVFQPGILYKFTYDLRPNFVDVRSWGNSPCLAKMGRETFSEEDFDKALARSRHMKLRTAVQVQMMDSNEQRVAQTYTMANEYDLEAMRRTIALEDDGHCEPVVKRTGYTRLMTTYERDQAYRGTSSDYEVKGAPLLKVQRRSTSLLAMNPHAERLLVDTRAPAKEVSTSLVDYGDAMLSPDGTSVAFLDCSGDADPTYRLGVYDLGTKSVSWPFQVSKGQTEFCEWMDDNSLFVQYYKVGDVAEKNWFSWVDRGGAEILRKGIPLATALTDVSELALSLDGKTYVRRDRSGEKPWFHCDKRVEFKFYGPPGDTLLVQETVEGRKDVTLPCLESCIGSAGWEGIPKLLGCTKD